MSSSGLAPSQLTEKVHLSCMDDCYESLLGVLMWALFPRNISNQPR